MMTWIYNAAFSYGKSELQVILGKPLRILPFLCNRYRPTLLGLSG